MQVMFVLIVTMSLSISVLAQELPMVSGEKKLEPPAQVSSNFEMVKPIRGRHMLSFSADWFKMTSKLKMNQTTTRDEDSGGKYTLSYNYNLGYLEPRVTLSWEYKNNDDVDTNDYSYRQVVQYFVGSDFNIFPNDPSQEWIPFGNVSLGYIEQKESVIRGALIGDSTLSGLALSAGVGIKYFPLAQNIFAIRTEVLWQTGINLNGDVHVKNATNNTTVDFDADATQTALNVDFCLYF